MAAARKPNETTVTVEEELLCTVRPLSKAKDGRSVRFFTVAQLEDLCKRIRRNGGSANAEVRIMRDPDNGSLRLNAKIVR